MGAEGKRDQEWPWSTAGYLFHSCTQRFYGVLLSFEMQLPDVRLVLMVTIIPIEHHCVNVVPCNDSSPLCRQKRARPVR